MWPYVVVAITHHVLPASASAHADTSPRIQSAGSQHKQGMMRFRTSGYNPSQRLLCHVKHAHSLSIS